jgi:hypothetical protein
MEYPTPAHIGIVVVVVIIINVVVIIIIYYNHHLRVGLFFKQEMFLSNNYVLNVALRPDTEAQSGAVGHIILTSANQLLVMGQIILS